MIQRVWLVLFLISVGSPTSAHQHDAASLLQDAVVSTLQAIACWKQEVQEDQELVALLEQVEEKITDPHTTQLEIGLYGLLLHRVRLLPVETQKILLGNLLSKTSDELIREAAVLVQVFRSAQQKDYKQQ